MSAVLFVVINCSSSFSAEKAENGDIAAQLILARVAVRVCMCVPIDESNVRVACCGACLWPRSADYELSSRAYFKAGAMPASARDLCPGGGPLNTGIWRRVSARSLRSFVLRVRGFYSAPPRLNPGVRINGNCNECAYNVEETIADS